MNQVMLQQNISAEGKGNSEIHKCLLKDTMYSHQRSNTKDTDVKSTILIHLTKKLNINPHITLQK